MLKKVLIVDDDSSIGNLISDIAGMLNCETKVLTNGSNILAVAKEWKPDLITLDIMMPSPDGIDCLSMLKKDKETKNIPALIISVVAKDAEFTSKLAFAESVFEKPLDVKLLASCIKKIVQT